MPRPNSGVLGERCIYKAGNSFVVRIAGRYVGSFQTLEAAKARRDFKTPKLCPTCGHRTYYAQ